jgi:hypothetical protein
MTELKDRPGVVPVFLGTFPSKGDFEPYFKETYDEDSSGIGASCPFWTDLGVDWLDHDFQDARYQGDVPSSPCAATCRTRASTPTTRSRPSLDHIQTACIRPGRLLRQLFVLGSSR